MNDKIDKIVFLDLDHVLTNTNDNTSFLCGNPAMYSLSKTNLKNLDKIIDATNASIVIASNWRKFKTPDIFWSFKGQMFKSLLEQLKPMYGGKIIDSLPVVHGMTKCGCLTKWLEANTWFSCNGRYAILEDDLDEKYQEHPTYCKHLVLTDYHVGLTAKDAERAIAMMS